MQAAAKQFRGDFFVAIDQPVGKFVRIEAPFLAGGVAVRGDAIAMPAVRHGRKGLVIRLVKLDSDSLGIPIPEASQQLAVTEEAGESAVDEFESEPTRASGVSAAVAESIKRSASGGGAPVVPLGARPELEALEELDDETREAVNEFGNVTTKASEVSADIAKTLAEPPPEQRSPAAHTIKRVTPGSGVARQVTPASGAPVTPAAKSAAAPGPSAKAPEPGPAGPPPEEAIANRARAGSPASEAKPEAPATDDPTAPAREAAAPPPDDGEDDRNEVPTKPERGPRRASSAGGSSEVAASTETAADPAVPEPMADSPSRSLSRRFASEPGEVVEPARKRPELILFVVLLVIAVAVAAAMFAITR